MKTPLQRLRELVKILKDSNDLILIEYNVESLGYNCEGLWQPRLGVMLLKNKPGTNDREIYYVEDRDLKDGEVLDIVESLEKML